MDSNFCVYMHFVDGETVPFYVGEGRIKRSRSSANRNRWWHFKVNKHGGCTAVRVAENLTKAEAEDLERRLISHYRDRGVPIANICSGPMFDAHWLAGKPKEMHPMFGKKRVMPEVAESNRRRAGAKLKPRPDLADRNRASQFKRFARAIQCKETGHVFPSITAAAAHVGVHDSKINRALKEGGRSGGFHWEYLTSRE